MGQNPITFKEIIQKTEELSIKELEELSRKISEIKALRISDINAVNEAEILYQINNTALPIEEEERFSNLVVKKKRGDSFSTRTH